MNKKTRIIHVVSYYPPHLGGMENFVYKISEELTKRKYKIEVFTSDRGYSRKNRKPNKSVHYMRSVEVAHTPIISSLLPRLLSLPKNSLIHLHISQAFTPEMVYLVSKIKKIPYIAHIHLDVDASGSFGFLLNPYKKYILSRVLKSADKVICQSIEQKSLISNKYNLDNKNIRIVPNGVGSEFFIKRSISKNKIPHILFVGRLSPQKNVPFMIKTISRVKSAVHLDIVGEGDQRNRIEKMINRLKLSNVTLHGKKTGNDLLTHYRTSDLFIICSEKEGLSLAVLEAMASGLPVIGADVSGIHELVGDSGVLIRNPNPKSFAREIDQLLSNKTKLKKLSVKAVKKAKKYSWKNVIDGIEKTYKETDYDY